MARERGARRGWRTGGAATAARHTCLLCGRPQASAQFAFAALREATPPRPAHAAGPVARPVAWLCLQCVDDLGGQEAVTAFTTAVAARYATDQLAVRRWHPPRGAHAP